MISEASDRQESVLSYFEHGLATIAANRIPLQSSTLSAARPITELIDQ